jgi:two-component system sensor histidine kinase GlrK
VRELGERTVDLERSARQYLVLDNPVFQQRFDQHWPSRSAWSTGSTVWRRPLRPLLGGWRMVAEALRSGLEQKVPQAELAPLLARMAELNGLMKQAAQRWGEDQNRLALDELEANRLHLGGWISLALLGAFLVASAIGWWLVRPVRQLEQAIVHLGANQFDQPITVGGPVDLRQLAGGWTGCASVWLSWNLIASGPCAMSRMN